MSFPIRAKLVHDERLSWDGCHARWMFAQKTLFSGLIKCIVMNSTKYELF